MKPKKFDQCNHVWGAPQGMEESVGGMPAYKGLEARTNLPVSISAWVVTDEDFERIKANRTIYLRVYSVGHPVVSVGTEDPWN